MKATLELISPRTPNTTRYITVHIEADLELTNQVLYDTPYGPYISPCTSITDIYIETESGLDITNKLKTKYPKTYESIIALLEA